MLLQILLGHAFIGLSLGAATGRHQHQRMYNGTEITVEQRPYQLAVFYDNNYLCNAVIIGERWALTTAFCATPLNPYRQPQEVAPEDFQIRSGSSKYQTGGHLHPVERVVVHEKYSLAPDELTPDFDVALFRVADPFVFDSTTQPCELWEFFPRTPRAPNNATFFVTGWQGEGAGDIVLSQVQVIDQRDCIAAYDSVPGANVTLNMFCAEQVSPDLGPCDYYDRGSPLTSDDKLLGLVASPTCLIDDLPTTYTNVVYLRLWIFLHSGISL